MRKIYKNCTIKFFDNLQVTKFEVTIRTINPDMYINDYLARNPHVEWLSTKCTKIKK